MTTTTKKIKILLALLAASAVLTAAGAQSNANAKSNAQSNAVKTFTDSRDGQTYRAVKIGKLTWMAENLRYRPREGRTWCSGHDNSNCDKYGRLYTGNAAMDVCPDGWRLPNNGDWEDLVSAAGGAGDAGGALKSKSGWSKSGNGSDKLGFAALPGGRQHGGSHAINSSYDLGTIGYWWSATNTADGYMWYWGMSSGGSEVFGKYNIRGNGYSVRCAADGEMFQGLAAASPAPAKQAATTTPSPAKSATVPAASPPFTDPRDGQTYRTVTVGELTWMAQNLNYRTQPVEGEEEESWCLNNDKSNCGKYGRLYTWEAAMNACPAGWRLATKDDWEDLVWEADGEDAAGGRLKSKSGWYKNGNGTDKFGFAALPGGTRFPSDGSFGGDVGGGFWWTSTERGVRQAWFRKMSSMWAGQPTTTVEEDYAQKYYGYSVRCARDADVEVAATDAPAPATPRPAVSTGTFTDARDGQTYRTVTIGEQTWMAQNINYKTNNSWCYDNDDSNCQRYGRLYNWVAAKGACPAGWRLPIWEEWDDLIWEDGDEELAGTTLKSKSGWVKNGNGTDKFGFAALPGGLRSDKDGGRFVDIGTRGHWWTATDDKLGTTWGRFMHSDYSRVHESYGLKADGFSVRCTRDGAVQSSASGAPAKAVPVIPAPVQRAKSQPSTPLTDPRDGKTYRTITIGKWTWMAENLNYAKPQTEDNWCYGGDSSNCGKYGRLYTWGAAMEACPAGWGVPTIEEWRDLIWEASEKYDVSMMLKSKSGWPKDGIDKFGFTALPGGLRWRDGNFGGVGQHARWWTATVGHQRNLARDVNIVSSDSVNMMNHFYTEDIGNGFSVRCIQGGAAKRSETAAPSPKPAAKPAPVIAPSTLPNTFTDPRDGQTYRTVQIGKLTWMAQNVNYQTDDIWDSWCAGNNNSNCNRYGRLYTWDGAMKACPAPWRLPSKKDWEDLVRETGDERYAGAALKSKTGWQNRGGHESLDKIGFAALPGGFRNTGGQFVYFGEDGYWWTATDYARNGNPWYRNINANSSGVGESYGFDKENGFSARCVCGGEDESVKSPAASPISSNMFTDSRDGQTYRTAKIGNKTWMAQNLNYKTDNSWCYGDDSSNCDKYGRLYTWIAANEACPSPWRLPNGTEWGELVAANGNADSAGYALKSKTGWTGRDYNANGADKFGFSALPGGTRKPPRPYVKDGTFDNINYYGYWWTSSGGGRGTAMYWNIGSAYSKVYYYHESENNGYSVRCIHD